MFILYQTSNMKWAPSILLKNLKILKDLRQHIQLACLRRKLRAEQIAIYNDEVKNKLPEYNKPLTDSIRDTHKELMQNEIL
jgi:transcriptional regulator of met regulon